MKEEGKADKDWERGEQGKFNDGSNNNGSGSCDWPEAVTNNLISAVAQCTCQACVSNTYEKHLLIPTCC
jgi:hypothetical protein